MKIAIDFDQTLFPTLEKVIEIYNKRNNTSIDMSQIITYNLYDCLSEDVADELISLFVDKTTYNSLQPYKGSIKAIQSLVSKGHEIIIATATDSRNLEWKEKLLQRYFPFIPKENLIRIHNKKLLNVDVLVDDKLDNLTQTFAERVCYTQSWNVDKDTDYVYSIYRINNWGEINNIIIMSILSKKNATSVATGITTEDMEGFCPIGKSYTTLHRALHFLCKGGYISVGVKDGKFNTYYINSTGVEKLKEML